MSLEFFLLHVCLLAIALLLTQSLNLIWKANLFSLGHHGYYAIGAYTSVVMLRLILGSEVIWRFETGSDRWLGALLWLACLTVGGLVAGLAAWLSSRAFGHLRGDYFAVATLILAEIVRNVVSHSSYVGGGMGFEVPALFVLDGGDERLIYHIVYAVILVALNVGLFWGLRQVDRSVYGLYITATRNDNLAAELSGVDARRLQEVVFTAGGVVAGIAGAFFLHFQQFLVPNDFSFTNGLPIILYVVLGRLGTLRCVIAAAAVYIMFEVIKLRFLGLLGDTYGQLLADWKEVLLALVLIFAATGPVSLKRLVSWYRHRKRS